MTADSLADVAGDLDKLGCVGIDVGKLGVVGKDVDSPVGVAGDVGKLGCVGTQRERYKERERLSEAPRRGHRAVQGQQIHSIPGQSESPCGLSDAAVVVPSVGMPKQRGAPVGALELPPCGHLRA